MRSVDRNGIGRVSCPHTARDRAKKSWSRGGKKALENKVPVESSSEEVNRVALQDVARERFADLLRVAFPGGSDIEVARQAARVLGYHEKTVLNWLRCETAAPFEVAFAIGAMELVGVFRVMDVMTRGQSRGSVWGLITGKVRRVVGK
jgi:hypothetical protein